ncbi:MAG: hypothetical protein V6Z86_08445 [Hyphomicrobiales bacterium]
MESIECELGKLNAKVERLEQDVGRMQGDLRAIRDVVVSTRGGWKMLFTLVSLAGVIGAMVARFVPFADVTR